MRVETSSPTLVAEWTRVGLFAARGNDETLGEVRRAR